MAQERWLVSQKPLTVHDQQLHNLSSIKLKTSSRLPLNFLRVRFQLLPLIQILGNLAVKYQQTISLNYQIALKSMGLFNLLLCGRKMIVTN